MTREAIGKVYETWMTAFPDLVGSQEGLVIDGDRVAQLTTLVGTDAGGFMGLAPSNKKFRRRRTDRAGTAGRRFHRDAGANRHGEGASGRSLGRAGDARRCG